VLVQVEAALKRAGSDEVSFATQVCSGPRTAQVVAFADDTVLEDPVLVTRAGPERLSSLPVRVGEWPQ
jgi:hypothetical protein